MVGAHRRPTVGRGSRFRGPPGNVALAMKKLAVKAPAHSDHAPCIARDSGKVVGGAAGFGLPGLSAIDRVLDDAPTVSEIDIASVTAPDRHDLVLRIASLPARAAIRRMQDDALHGSKPALTRDVDILGAAAPCGGEIEIVIEVRQQPRRATVGRVQQGPGMTRGVQIVRIAAPDRVEIISLRCRGVPVPLGRVRRRRRTWARRDPCGDHITGLLVSDLRDLRRWGRQHQRESLLCNGRMLGWGRPGGRHGWDRRHDWLLARRTPPGDSSEHDSVHQVRTHDASITIQ